jgi:clan AA aspartic protease (TIGR02281 family)
MPLSLQDEDNVMSLDDREYIKTARQQAQRPRQSGFWKQIPLLLVLAYSVNYVVKYSSGLDLYNSAATALTTALNYIASLEHTQLLAEIQQPFLRQNSPPNSSSQQRNTRSIQLEADRSGQYKGTAKINNVAIPFIIDTGANITVIPAKLAQAAGLKPGRPILTSTAGGVVNDNLTTIDSLRIGKAEIKQLPAIINQHMEYALLGVNTLKYFKLTQDVNTITLEAFDNPEIALAFQEQNPNNFHYFDIQLDWNSPGPEWQRLKMEGKDCFYQHENALETVSCKGKQQGRFAFIELDWHRAGPDWQKIQMDGKDCYYQNDSRVETISCRDKAS